jgi:hypothetical protein
METRRKKQTNLFAMTSEGFLIVVCNNSFIDSKKHFLDPTYFNYFKDFTHHMIPQIANFPPQMSRDDCLFCKRTTKKFG